MYNRLLPTVVYFPFFLSNRPDFNVLENPLRDVIKQIIMKHTINYDDTTLNKFHI